MDGPEVDGTGRFDAFALSKTGPWHLLFGRVFLYKLDYSSGGWYLEETSAFVAGFEGYWAVDGTSTTGDESSWEVHNASTTGDEGTWAVNNAYTTGDEGSWAVDKASTLAVEGVIGTSGS